MLPLLLGLTLTVSQPGVPVTPSFGYLWPINRADHPETIIAGPGQVYTPQEGDMIFYSAKRPLFRVLYALAATKHPYHSSLVIRRCDGSLALLDFQIIGTGTAAYDLAYFVTQSLEADVAADQERVLFERWVSALHAAGVPVDETGRLWEDYRLAALFCLVYPVVASRGMDVSDPRQRALLETMSARLGRAIDHLELASLI